MYRFAFTNGSRWLLAWVGLAVAGCSAVPHPEANPAAPVPVSAVKLTYRTASDRINMVAPTTLLTSYVATSTPAEIQPLPNFTTTTINILSPHPQGLTGFAQVTVVTKSDKAAATAPSVWARLTGGAGTEKTDTVAADVRVMDIPQWQVEAIVKKLRTNNFFSRGKILNADVFLAAEVGPQKMGKECKSMPELDALILRCRSEGRPVSGGSPTANAPSAVATVPTLLPAPASDATTSPGYSASPPTDNAPPKESAEFEHSRPLNVPLFEVR